MNIAEELERLQKLHRDGALTDEEFANAKAALIATMPANPLPIPSQPPRRVEVRPRLVVGSLLLLAAFFTNPDQASFEKTCRENMEKERQNSGILEKVVGTVLLKTSFERTNYYLFSVGTVKSRMRGVGAQVDVEVFGAFGNWWFDLARIPLVYDGERQKAKTLAGSHAAISLSWPFYVVVLSVLLVVSQAVVFGLIELVRGPVKEIDKRTDGMAQQSTQSGGGKSSEPHDS